MSSPPYRNIGWIWRLVIAGSLGVLMTAISLYLAWGHCKITMSRPDRYTKDIIQRFGICLELFRSQKERYPENLLELKHFLANLPKHDNYDVEFVDHRIQADGNAKDDWNGVLEYEGGVDSYELVSRGSDHRPGGSGMATDISSNNLNITVDPSVLEVFIYSPSLDSLLTVCFLSGLISFILVMTAKMEEGTIMTEWLAKIVGSVIALVFGTWILMAVLYSGH